MKKQYHILNGSALKATFPKQILGEIIVAKECFVDGNVKGDDLQNLYEVRALYLSNSYGGTIDDYYIKAVSEFNKIKQILKNSEVYLWFEDDLFCQVNFWFILHLLNKQSFCRNIYYVRPTVDMQFGFGGMTRIQLIEALRNKIKIELPGFNQLNQLWKYYQNDSFQEMTFIAKKMEGKYPFLLPAVKAHKERFPKNNKLGRPEQSILNIIHELKTDNFPIVFKEFCKRESIYGFGDLQVRKIFNLVISKNQ